MRRGRRMEALELEQRAEEFSAHEILLDPLAWHDPKPLGRDLLPVPELKADMLPNALRDWVQDTAERMDRMPLDFVAVGVLCALGSLIGRRLAVRPKREESEWVVVPNLWGACIGGPSTKKSPALGAALSFTKSLENDARHRFELESKDHAISVEAAKVYRKAQEVDLKKAAKRDIAEARSMLEAIDREEPEPPAQKRYVLNDSTIEKAGELLRENPNGLLLYRDELTGWLASLDQVGREQDRAFFLEAWNGNASFSWDRIGRGSIHVPSLCLGIVGGIQPAKVRPYLRSMASGNGDDGLLQRFQLMVWPDPLPPARVDRKPNEAAKRRVADLFESIDKLPDFDGSEAGMGFDPDAQIVFDEWYEAMLVKEATERDTHVEAHLVKMHSLMPALALIFHLADGAEGEIGDIAATRATVWCDFLEAHARRIYALASDQYHGARSLLKRFDTLPNPFTKSDFNNKGWSGLASADEIDTALKALVDHGYIGALEVKTGTKPRCVYYKNPHDIEE